ncbi:YdcF family protein [Microvirga thermotolerans]|uniref:YdcF family protein n=1 Tax=Microvirga thermotolerans TaxID=2651334 RepID=A0A5P9JWF8_9HYPH|nr:YdcF family protein [Microvirga thermotolerans]QFU16773.1 YdcF family protein [Microvirga thermotolerans]
MFYLASKIAWFFATPSNLLASLVLLGIVLGMTKRCRRLGQGIALSGALALLAFGLLPVSSALLKPLEERFPAFRDDGRPVDGIILLGGAVEASDSLSRGSLAANESAERVLDTLTLARRYPKARILISGGGGTVFGDGAAEAPVIAAYLEGVGIDPARIVVEDRSRTTAENATFTRALIDPAKGERWLLVTSAWHMPRAMGVFRKAGLDVVAYPVDYRTGAGEDALRPFAFVSDGLRRLDVAAKEWAGLVAYYAAGKTPALLPAP